MSAEVRLSYVPGILSPIFMGTCFSLLWFVSFLFCVLFLRMIDLDFGHIVWALQFFGSPLLWLDLIVPGMPLAPGGLHVLSSYFLIGTFWGFVSRRRAFKSRLRFLRDSLFVFGTAWAGVAAIGGLVLASMAAGGVG